MSRSHGAAASATLGAALAALAFVAKGGNQVGPTAAAEVAVVLLAGVALAAFALRGRPGRLNGGLALALFAALAIFTALSVAWSIAPGETVKESARTFAYLAIFATALIAAHVRRRAAGVVLGGVLLAGVSVCGWALVTRIFPGSFAELVLGARLGAPFGYWNALGAMAALSLPGALWLGSRRTGAAAVTALAYPAVAVLLLTLLLTQSRGALGAGVLVVVLWLAAAPARLRSVAVIAAPALAVAPVAAWALSKDAFTTQLQPLSAREAVAGDFGLMVLAALVAAMAAGLAVELVRRRRAPSPSARRWIGAALAGAAGLAVVAAVAVLALSDRGLVGTVSDRVADLTSAQAATPSGAARFGSVSSSRGGYWREAVKVFREEPLIGRGANSFGTARLIHRRDGATADQAHGYLAQTLADLGLIGVALALALLCAWLWAAARTIGPLRRGPSRPPGGERGALIGLALTAIGFGVHSAIDWTWFVPGPTAAALVAAGFVAGRGRMAAGEVLSSADGPTAPASAAPSATGRARRTLRERWMLVRSRPERLVAAAAVLLTAVLCAWAVWQPERAANAGERASELLDEGDLEGAAEYADRAREIDPYSPGPLYAQAAVLTQAGSLRLAYRTYERAVAEHPRDPFTWLRLASFEMELDLPARALVTLQGATRVDPRNGRIPPLVAAAQAALAPPPAAVPAPPVPPSAAAPVPPSAAAPAAPLPAAPPAAPAAPPSAGAPAPP